MALQQHRHEFPPELKKLLTRAHEHKDALAFLHAIWDQQPDGYFCLSFRPIACACHPNRSAEKAAFHDWWWYKENGKWSYHMGTLPEFVRDEAEDAGGTAMIVCEKWDTYFCVNAFDRMDRHKAYALPGRWLFADLDYVPPHEIPYPATYSWETSPGRWQCVWYMQQFLEPAEFDWANKTMCKQSGADTGTWNRNRLLRVAGSHHLKGERKEWDSQHAA